MTLAIALRFWLLSRVLRHYAVLLFTRSPQPPLDSARDFNDI